MGMRESFIQVLLAVAVLCGPACNSNTTTPLGPDPPEFPVPTPALTCDAEQSGDRWVYFRVALTGPRDVQYVTTVVFGDGAEERRTMYATSPDSFSHRYEHNGSYLVEAIARNVDTNDRLTCSRPVVYERCERSRDMDDDFTFDRRWSRTVVTDGPGMSETASWQRSGEVFTGYRRMTHQFTATTAPTFVSMFVYHVNQEYSTLSGPIDHIRYREDRIKFAPLTATSSVGGGVLIVQNGINHLAPLTSGAFANSSWERVDATLRASDFTPMPDFSEGAPGMMFGYYRSNSNRYPLVIEHGIDNWRVEVCR